MLVPVRVSGRDRISAEAGRDRPDRLVVAEVQHEQRLGVWHGRTVFAAGSQFEMGAGAGHLEEHAAVAVVILEATDLGQTKAVAVETDEVVEALGVASHAQLHPRDLTASRFRASAGLSPGAATSQAAAQAPERVAGQRRLEVKLRRGHDPPDHHVLPDDQQ